jgi:hypothetical protein
MNCQEKVKLKLKNGCESRHYDLSLSVSVPVKSGDPDQYDAQ